MAYKNHYGNVIWTNHAIDRMRDRGLSQEQAWVAFRNPDSQSDNKNQDSKEFKKRFGDSLVTIIAKQNEKKEWIILSVWSRLVYKKGSEQKKVSLGRLLYNFIFKK